MSGFHVHGQWGAFRLALTCALIVATLLYLRGWFRLRTICPSFIDRWQLSAFIGGLFLVWTAVGSSLATLDHQSLTMHMAKHLLLMTVASPLLLAGMPALPLLYGFPARFVKNLGSQLARSVERSPKYPLLCWLAATITLIGWHLPVAFELGVRSDWMHTLEDGCFLLAGLLFWWPVVRPSPTATISPQWSIALYLFMATLPCDIVSAFLVFCNRLAYPYYLSRTQLFRLSPLQDQECAGALMWVWVTFAYLIPAVIITMQMLSPVSTHTQRAAQAACPELGVCSLNGAETEGL
jgi:putative membrane protein